MKPAAIYAPRHCPPPAEPDTIPVALATALAVSLLCRQAQRGNPDAYLLMRVLWAPLAGAA